MNNFKKERRKVNGLLLLDKPIGMTSNAILQHVKRLYNADKAGHTGSLDPIASGMLPICFGEATKFSQFLLDADKRYVVTGKLGVTTSTDDTEGTVIATASCAHVTKEQVEKVLAKFIGTISQMPPMHSAIKMNGQPLYKLAHQGITVERQPRSLTIYEIQLKKLTKDTIELFVHCSKGTYIRTLIGDIGKDLACGAHIVELRRCGVGPYQEAEMLNVQRLEQLSLAKEYAKLDAFLLPIETLMYNCPELYLTENTAYYLRQGQPVMVPNAPSNGWVKLKTKDGRFLGAGEIDNDGMVAPRRLIKIMING